MGEYIRYYVINQAHNGKGPFLAILMDFACVYYVDTSIYILVSVILAHWGIFNEFLVLTPHFIDTYLAHLLCLLSATH